MSYFLFAGEHSETYRLRLESPPRYTTAQRRITTQSVPGRNGLVVYDEGAYDNVDGTFDVYYNAKSTNTMIAGMDLAAWLLRPTGYQRLEDSYNPDVYRLAVCTGPLDVENHLQKYGKATLTFNCMPQRFFKAGETALSISNGAVLTNPWMSAKPTVYITGSGEGVFSCNDYQVTISDIPESGITLDCETEDAYQGEDNLNSLISAVSNEGFPCLDHGKTKIAWSGGITAVKIMPRWWAL